MKVFIARHPLAFSLLLTLALFGLLAVSRAALPTYVVLSVADLPPEALEKPSAWEQAIGFIRSAENLFYLLAVLLAALLLTWLSWWREAGFNRPSRWQNLHLFLFLLLIGVLSLLGGVEVPGPEYFIPALFGLLLAVFSEEVLYRGIVWRALVPAGLMWAVVVTSLLSGALLFGRLVTASPWPEAVYLSVLAVCGGFMYAALRWRTASIWPVILGHFLLDLVSDISTPETVPYLMPLLLFAVTLGFVGYGLFLLRNPRVRADGALTAQGPARVR